MSQQILFRRDTSANWFSANPILAQGEMGLDLTLNKFKMGDGSTAWNSLSFTTSIDSTSLKIISNLNDLDDPAAARSNLGLGSAAEVATTAFDAAGTAATEVSNHVGNSDPHTQYLKESDNLLINPKTIKVKTSNAGTGEFTSIAAAITYIATQSPSITNRFTIEVGSGTFTEPLLDLSLVPYTSIKGMSINTTIIEPDSSLHHIMILGVYNEVSFLMLQNAGAGYAGIAMEDTGSYGLAHKVLIQDCDIGILVTATTVDTDFYGEYVDIEGTFSYGVRIVAETSALAYCAVIDYYANPIANSTGVHVQGPYSTFIATVLEHYGPATGTGIHTEDGAFVEISAATIEGMSEAIHSPNIGAGSIIRVLGSRLEDNTTDLLIEHASTTGSFQGVSSHAKVSNISPTFHWLFLDVDDGETEIRGDLSTTYDDGTHTDLSTLIRASSTSGVISGGVISVNSGLDVDIASGVGYLDLAGVLHKIVFSADTFTLTASAENFLYYTSASVLTTSTAMPDLIQNVYLGRVVTTASGVEFIANAPMIGSHFNNKAEIFFREAFGPIFYSGCAVSAHATPRHLTITGGEYYLSVKEFKPSGATDITFTEYKHNGSSAWVQTSLQVVNNTHYNNGNTYTTIPTGDYTKHALYLIGDGAEEKYFLILGQETFASLLLAEGGNLPIEPGYFNNAVVLIASIIMQEGVSTIVEILDSRPTLGFKATGTSASSDHQALSNRSDASAHTQYLLKSQTDSMGINLDMGGFSITNINLVDGVDVNAHAAAHLPNGGDALASGTPSTINTANTTGTANAFARQDHIHSHGNQTAETHHAVATTSLNGFMSSTDKTKLDIVSSTELDYVAGVTSDIQTQLGDKVPKTTTVNGHALSGDISVTAGTTAQVQYNNAGDFAGAANVHIHNEDLSLVVNSSPTVPPSLEVKLFGKNVSGRIMPAFIGPLGLDSTLQVNMARNKVLLWSAAGNSTTVTAIGAGTLSVTGTATVATAATTNLYTYQKKVEYLVTTAAITAIAGWRSTQAQWTIGGSSAELGGFHYIARFGCATGVATTTNRCFVGMTSATTAPTDVQPSSLTNMCGVGWDAADTNIQFMYGGSGAATKVNLGASFPVPTVDRTKTYEIAIFSPPGVTQSISYEITELGTSNVATGTITTNLPTNTTLLTTRGWMSVGGTSSVIGISLISVYIESDY
jgi:hypothetical protein